MMQQPLDGARFKVVRAQEHLDSLKAEVRAYLDEKPYEIIAEAKADVVVSRIELKIPPPLRLAAIMGDCVGNIRASLDYVAWELAIKHFQTPALIPDEDRRWVSFPLYTNLSDAGYVNKINRLKNRGVPADALDQIAAVQPAAADYEPLWWLHELVNADKHRFPLLTVGKVQSTHMALRVGNQFTEIRMPMGFTSVVVARDLNAADDAATKPDVQVNGQATVFVTFKDVSMPRIPVDRVLSQIVECVANVIPRFDRLF